MIILLRGHIRNAFESPTLYNCLNTLHRLYGITIYIHTWNVINGSLSWRSLAENLTIVTQELIYTYFKDLPIARIIIDDDAHIQLIGNVDGLMADTLLPIRAWKNMWYGMHRIIAYIPDEIILNMRFDFFNNFIVVDSDERVFNFIAKYINSDLYNIKFIIDYVGFGLDNMYMGKLSTITTLINHFYYNLDEIIGKYNKIKCQEFLVLWENDALFPAQVNAQVNAQVRPFASTLLNVVSTKLTWSSAPIIAPPHSVHTQSAKQLTTRSTLRQSAAIISKPIKHNHNTSNIVIPKPVTRSQPELRTGTTYLFSNRVNI